MSFERLFIEEMRRRKRAEEKASETLREMYSAQLKAAVAEGLLPPADSLEGWQREILMQELSREMALNFSSIRHSWHRTQKRIQEVQNAAQTPTGERHTFELSVQPEVLAACMRRMGREIEANGGVIEWDFVNNRTWRVKAIPEVTTEGETMLLTWRCGSVPGIDSDVHPVFDAPCIEWRVNPAFLGVRIDAICADVRFEKTFYQWIIIDPNNWTTC